MNLKDRLKKWPKDDQGRYLCTGKFAMPQKFKKTVPEGMVWLHVDAEDSPAELWYCPHCGYTFKALSDG